MRIVLLGDPVEHSRSPAIHNAAFATARIDGAYEARRVDAAGAAEAFADIAAGHLGGANVTMPHKRLAFAACKGVDRDAAAAGAVNTLVADEAGLFGWNTDVIALRTILASMEPDAPLLVLGAGGAAAAALVAGEGRRRLVASRGADAVDRLGATIGPLEEHAWTAPFAGAVVVNATPLGMAGEPLPSGVLDGAVGLIDLAYGSATTPAVEHAKDLGMPFADGIAVLVEQAVHAFAIWTGVQPDRTVMMAAARPA